MRRKIIRLIYDWKKFSDGKNILIYQMGKTGSTSLMKSIEHSIHVHTLFAVDHGPSLESKGIFPVVRDFLRRHAIKSRKEKVKIISPIRSLIDRNISMFFQELPGWLMKHHKLHKVDWRANEGLDLKDVLENTFNSDFGINWMEKELGRLTGVDVYAEEWDVDRGFAIIENDNFEVLLIDFSKLNESVNLLGQFVGQDLSLCNENSGEKKWYAPLYKDFKSSYVPGEDYKNVIESCLFQRHFYPK